MRKLKLLGILMLVSLTMFSQGRKEEVRKKIESKKIAYLTEHLNLSVEESQVFWPLYNEYNNNLASGRPFDMSRTDDLSADEKLDQVIMIEQEKLDLKKNYMSKFKEAIGAEKTLDFFIFERQFRERMLRDIGEKRKKMRARGK